MAMITELPGKRTGNPGPGRARIEFPLQTMVWTMTRLILAVFAIVATCTQFVRAADDGTVDAANCVDIADDAARLRCYDEAARPPAPPAAQPVPAAAPVAQPVPATETVARPAPAPEPVPPPAAEPQPAPAAEAETAEFGLADKQEEVREITAVVTEVIRRSHSGLVVTLDNGQVWAEKEAENYFRVQAGDTVVIKKNRMGGFRMVGRGNRASAVTRIQ